MKKRSAVFFCKSNTLVIRKKNWPKEIKKASTDLEVIYPTFELTNTTINKAQNEAYNLACCILRAGWDDLGTYFMNNLAQNP